VARRFTLSLLAATAIALATTATWKVLKDHQTEQIARLAEIESYAVRSQLVRNIDSMLRAFRDLHEYWSRNAQLPRAEWAPDARTELADLAGVETILWSNQAGDVRYLRTAEHPMLDYRPTQEEWERLSGLRARSSALSETSILGPYTGEAGEVTIEVHVIPEEGEDTGNLIAVLDTHDMFARMLLDESPGYAISISWNGVPMYQRGEPAQALPESWTREGMIMPLTGELWRIVHAPTDTLADSLQTPAVPGTLASGLAIALLVGLLLYENGRARSRAAAAEVAEQKLADLNRDLEAQIAERVKELADRSTDLETITDSVAHDLRNPLNSISVNTQLLQQQFQDVLDEEGLEALKRTASGVRRMTEILDRLLGLSVVSHATFKPEELDMEAVITDVFEELSAPEQPPPVELEVRELPQADADPTLVRTLVTNLLSNAIKYTRDKPLRRIEVSADRQDGAVVYCIRDNGVGFDPDSRERMFQAFERLDGTREEDGIGLGLDIAARVVRRHGGRIWANGKPGDGAAFYFTLQAAADGASADVASADEGRQLREG
jgi:signal transduction histidine kinase